MRSTTPNLDIISNHLKEELNECEKFRDTLKTADMMIKESVSDIRQPTDRCIDVRRDGKCGYWMCALNFNILLVTGHLDKQYNDPNYKPYYERFIKLLNHYRDYIFKTNKPKHIKSLSELKELVLSASAAQNKTDTNGSIRHMHLITPVIRCMIQTLNVENNLTAPEQTEESSQQIVTGAPEDKKEENDRLETNEGYQQVITATPKHDNEEKEEKNAIESTPLTVQHSIEKKASDVERGYDNTSHTESFKTPQSLAEKIDNPKLDELNSDCSDSTPDYTYESDESSLCSGDIGVEKNQNILNSMAQEVLNEIIQEASNRVKKSKLDNLNKSLITKKDTPPFEESSHVSSACQEIEKKHNNSPETDTQHPKGYQAKSDTDSELSRLGITDRFLNHAIQQEQSITTPYWLEYTDIQSFSTALGMTPVMVKNISNIRNIYDQAQFYLADPSNRTHLKNSFTSYTWARDDVIDYLNYDGQVEKYNQPLLKILFECTQAPTQTNSLFTTGSNIQGMHYLVLVSDKLMNDAAKVGLAIPESKSFPEIHAGNCHQERFEIPIATHQPDETPQYPIIDSDETEFLEGMLTWFVGVICCILFNAPIAVIAMVALVPPLFVLIDNYLSEDIDLSIGKYSDQGPTEYVFEQKFSVAPAAVLDNPDKIEIAPLTEKNHDSPGGIIAPISNCTIAEI